MQAGRLEMGQSPLRWALGVAAAVALSATFHGDRIARLAGREAPTLATASVPGQAPAQAPARPPGRPTLTVAADSRGHYVVHPSVDNFRIRMMVDTGASIVALTAADARALGIQLSAGDYKMTLNTANGAVKGARVTLREVRLGDILVRHVEAVVLPAGALQMSLLGASFLGRLQGYEVQTGRMVLRG